MIVKNDHFLAEVNKDWTLFLDRDGVINRKLDNDYVKALNEFELLPGVLEALFILKDWFSTIIIVTNQQGIGKGLMTEANLSWIHQYLFTEVENAHGRIDAVYFCPHLEGEDCSCRKPGPGMAFQAKNDFNSIEFQKSIIVGDSQSDMEFGQKLGMKRVFCGKIKTFHGEVDLRVQDLLQFSRLLTSYSSAG
ncbi:MAG: HAD family hydrolase [Saprospiraceae bacterium]|nr:HAD family hydrolase [Saprospiraceae bacterium]MBK9689715.1 HAD family hydrolase [Saprospiraceae bacterium]MBL0081263.1 HAD family hydrolase [Saprospiraceae bacterium]